MGNSSVPHTVRAGSGFLREILDKGACSQFPISHFTERIFQVWGEAYGKGESLLLTHLFTSNSVLEQQSILPDSFLVHHYPNAHQSFNSMGIEDRLPPAQERPLFYVAVYAAIGLLTVIVSVTSSATQYTGALYASRTLFSRLLQTVVCAVSVVATAFVTVTYLAFLRASQDHAMARYHSNRSDSQPLQQGYRNGRF